MWSHQKFQIPNKPKCGTCTYRYPGTMLRSYFSYTHSLSSATWHPGIEMPPPPTDNGSLRLMIFVIFAKTHTLKSYFQHSFFIIFMFVQAESPKCNIYGHATCWLFSSMRNKQTQNKNYYHIAPNYYQNSSVSDYAHEKKSCFKDKCVDFRYANDWFLLIKIVQFSFSFHSFSRMYAEYLGSVHKHLLGAEIPPQTSKIQVPFFCLIMKIMGQPRGIGGGMIFKVGGGNFLKKKMAHQRRPSRLRDAGSVWGGMCPLRSWSFFENVGLNEAIWCTIFHHVKHLTACLLGTFFTVEQDGQKRTFSFPGVNPIQNHVI